VLDLAAIQRCFGIGSQGITGIKLMVEFLEADLPSFSPAHAVEFGSDNRIVAPSLFSGEEIADVRGGSPSYLGNELTDDRAAKCHKLNNRGDVFLWRSPAKGFIPSVSSRLKLFAGVPVMLG
jgi:hypothetical protein